MTEREKISARIRALLAKTVANGCTEDEAVAAAEMAAKLLDRYNLTVDEVEMRASPFSRHSERHEDATGERLWKVADAIARLTGARYWTSRPGVFPIEITFFGFDHEVQVARYLLDICARAMRQHETEIRASVRLLRATAQRRRIIPFLDGMADRLHRRIRAQIPPKPTGTGLVVLHGALIDQAMADAGLKTGQGNGRPSRDHEAAYRDGLRAGDRVGLNRGVTGSAAPRGLLA